MQIDYIKKAKDIDAVILSPSKYQIAANYAIEKEKLSIITNFIGFVVFFMWISFGLTYLDNISNNYNYWQKAIIFVDLFIIINWLISLPMEIYTLFRLDKKYQFSNITPKIFITDTIKSTVLFLIFGNLVIFGISYIINTFNNWWIWGFVFIFGVIITINMVYPIVRDKMFDKFSPLSDKELEAKITNLLQSVGFQSSGVFSVDASKRDNRLNAYFGGLGKTKRVVLFDTLIEKLTHNELLAVLGHELGHFKNKDIIKNIIIMGFVMFIFFAIFGNLPQSVFLELNISHTPSSIIILFLIFSSILSFFLMPLISYISRENEYNADKFGSDLSSKEDLVNALLKLVNENKSFPFSHPIYVFFYYSHPPLVDRLKELDYIVEAPPTN
jgi:STE24 endopeptidase